MRGSILDYITILRLSVCLLAGLAVFIGSLFVNAPFYSIILAVLITILISGGGVVLNDIYDIEIDRINKPHRPLPAGRIKIAHAKLYALVLLLTAAILSLALHLYASILAFFNIFIAFFYAVKIKKTMFAPFVDSWLAASTFIFGALLSGTIPLSVIILSSIAYAANVSREIAKAIEDIKGDKKMKVRSIPVLAGKKTSILLVIFFMLLAVSFSPLPYITGMFGIWYLLLIIITDIIFIISCYVIFFSASFAQKIMKIGMTSALLAFLVGMLF